MACPSSISSSAPAARCASVELPAVAGRLRRDLRHRDAVARLPRHPVAGSHRSLPEARAPLRRPGRRQRKLFVKRVLTAVILIPIVVLALFRAPLWLFTLLVLGVALLAAKEYFDIAETTGFKPARFLGYLFLLLLFLLVGCSLGTADIDNRRTFDTGDTVVAVLLGEFTAVRFVAASSLPVAGR